MKQVWSFTGSPRSKYEHRRASALLRNIQNIRICMGKKTYCFRNPRKWKDFNEKQLTLLKMRVKSLLCGPRADLWPFYGFLCKRFFPHTNPYILNVTQQCRCSTMLIFRAWATCRLIQVGNNRTDHFRYFFGVRVIYGEKIWGLVRLIEGVRLIRCPLIQVSLYFAPVLSRMKKIGNFTNITWKISVIL